ncbi:hypothetical protein SK128_001238 [Halocaridina rubra]|uniref:DNA-3-methyladenine glycosylase n=1 Tax=Halocaridina rubra TaxID=373956 RepID=A0AAN9AGK6_HALRR
MVDGKRVSGRIVETESYLGSTDMASHSYNGKRTPRNEPMYMEPGTVYVYKIYGMYHCLNISSKEEGSCVLIRSLEPVDGVEYMMDARQERRKKFKALKDHELCSGPSKLCQALNITKEICNKHDAVTSKVIWIERGTQVPESEIVISKRIGIDSVGPEWANKPFRFYVYQNKNVSVRDKKAEANMHYM